MGGTLYFFWFSPALPVFQISTGYALMCRNNVFDLQHFIDSFHTDIESVKITEQQIFVGFEQFINPVCNKVDQGVFVDGLILETPRF